MEFRDKFVDFTKCRDCKHYEAPDEEEPCNTCLATPVNEHTTTPINFEEKKLGR